MQRMRKMELKDVKCFLLDMDGTFYLGGQLIDGSLDFIDKVVSSGRDFMFLTNNSSHNANFYVQKLAKMGLSIDRSKVMTSGEATCEKLNELYPGKRCFVLGNEFLKAEFAEAGIAVDDENPEVVVIGFDTTLTYQKMWDVCNFVAPACPISPPIRTSTVRPRPASCPTSARSSTSSPPRLDAVRIGSSASRTPASSRPCCAAPG